MPLSKAVIAIALVAIVGVWSEDGLDTCCTTSKSCISCENGGSPNCDNDDEDAVCICFEPYIGVKCEYDSDPQMVTVETNGMVILPSGSAELPATDISTTCCTSSTNCITCENWGFPNCDDKDADPTCTCINPYTGVNCETNSEVYIRKTSICDPPCLNGGHCSFGKCVCTTGYKGNTCETIDCGTCQNGGYCIDTHTCRCLGGYQGNECETPICTHPCQNGGTCIAPNTCECKWRGGYLGRTCEIPGCYPACQNGGTCMTSTTPATCKCPPSYCHYACASRPRCG